MTINSQSFKINTLRNNGVPGLNRSAIMIIAVMLILSIVSCSRVDHGSPYVEQGLWHTVQPGEDLDGISEKYAVSKLTLQQINDIFDPRDISPGMRLFIPLPKKIEPREPDRKKNAISRRIEFVWPAQGTISSGYGMRHGRMHEGIDITKDEGREVRAAAAGTVIFSGIKNGYGRTILIRHSNGLSTLYAHNAKLFVRQGNRVKLGAIIAKMGSSGKSNGIHLHFEVRLHNKTQNPLRYLPVR
ncbi:LysM peptidoglycan-binding domain-containing M23 family metallopeptidase [bacterium]|nr:LysM peptidoglycan-binding domain-containing M23 family metallopeptidase [bacterium]